MHYYLIVSEGGQERVLCEGSIKELEALARKLRSAQLFRYVRVDRTAPPAIARRPRRGNGTPATAAGDASAASA